MTMIAKKIRLATILRESSVVPEFHFQRLIFLNDWFVHAVFLPVFGLGSDRQQLHKAAEVLIP